MQKAKRKKFLDRLVHENIDLIKSYTDELGSDEEILDKANMKTEQFQQMHD